jgi:hypothetical protein
MRTFLVKAKSIQESYQGTNIEFSASNQKENFTELFEMLQQTRELQKQKGIISDFLTNLRNRFNFSKKNTFLYFDI